MNINFRNLCFSLVDLNLILSADWRLSFPMLRLCFGYLCKFIVFIYFLDFGINWISFVSLLTFQKWLMIAF